MQNTNMTPVDEPKTEVQAEEDRLRLAASVFKQYTLDFRRLVQGFSNKQLKRFAINLVEHPLSEQPIRLPSPEEVKAFQMATDILNAKNQMIRTFKEQEQRAATEKLMEENRGLIDAAFFDNIEKSRTAFVQAVEAFNEEVKKAKEVKAPETPVQEEKTNE